MFSFTRLATFSALNNKNPNIPSMNNTNEMLIIVVKYDARTFRL
jgi:hypothetical protein